MIKKIGAGMLSGILGGLVLDVLMRFFPVHGPDGSSMSMIGYLGTSLRPSDPWLGWIGYVLYGAVIGGIFGGILAELKLGARLGALWGVLYGLVWWAISCLVFVSLHLGSLQFAEAGREVMRQIGFPLLTGHLVYGAVLGAGSSLLSRTALGPRRHQTHATTLSARR